MSEDIEKIVLNEPVPCGSLGRWVTDFELDKLKKSHPGFFSHGVVRVKRTDKKNDSAGEVIVPKNGNWTKLGLFGEYKHSSSRGGVEHGVYDVTCNSEVKEYAEQEPERVSIDEIYSCAKRNGGDTPS